MTCKHLQFPQAKTAKHQFLQSHCLPMPLRCGDLTVASAAKRFLVNHLVDFYKERPVAELTGHQRYGLRLNLFKIVQGFEKALQPASTCPAASTSGATSRPNVKQTLNRALTLCALDLNVFHRFQSLICEIVAHRTRTP